MGGAVRWWEKEGKSEDLWWMDGEWQPRLRFVSSSTSPHSLVLSPLVLHNSICRREATWRAEGKWGGVGAGDWNGTHLPLCTFSPNYHGSTTSCRLSAILLFTNHWKYLQTHFNEVKALLWLPELLLLQVYVVLQNSNFSLSLKIMLKIKKSHQLKSTTV